MTHILQVIGDEDFDGDTDFGIWPKITSRPRENQILKLILTLLLSRILRAFQKYNLFYVSRPEMPKYACTVKMDVNIGDLLPIAQQK